jgi:hypothetical protein
LRHAPAAFLPAGDWADESHISGKIRGRVCGGLGKAHRFGFLASGFCVQQRIFRKSAELRAADDSVAGSKRIDSFADAFDDASQVHSGHKRRLELELVASLAQKNIGEVDACSFNLNEQLARSWHRLFDVGNSGSGQVFGDFVANKRLHNENRLSELTMMREKSRKL